MTIKKVVDKPENESVEKTDKDFREEVEGVYQMWDDAWFSDGFPKTFDDIEYEPNLWQFKDGVSMLSSILNNLNENILAAVDMDIEDKVKAITKNVDVFANKASELANSFTGEINSKSILDRVKSLFARKEKVTMQLKSANYDDGMLSIWKDSNGVYRWEALYTNAYRDREKEILSAKSHERFVELVDSGVVPMPVLKHWHIDGTEWGEADFLHYDKETGFLLAIGHVYSVKEKEAEALIELSKELNVATSHGMPVISIKREKDNPYVIEEYVTEEISDLPQWAAANTLSNFEILNKEVISMTLPDAKKDYLRQLGYSDEQIADKEALMASKAVEAEEAKLDFKEKDVKDADVAETETTEEETQTEEETADVETEEQESEAETDTDEEKKELQELVAVIQKEIAVPLGDAIKTVAEAVVGLTERVKGLETVEEKQKSAMDLVLSLTPPEALAGRLARELAASGSKDTIVRKNSAIAKDAPEETETNEEGIPLVNSGNPFIDGIVSSVVQATNQENLEA